MITPFRHLVVLGLGQAAPGCQGQSAQAGQGQDDALSDYEGAESLFLFIDIPPLWLGSSVVVAAVRAGHETAVAIVVTIEDTAAGSTTLREISDAYSVFGTIDNEHSIHLLITSSSFGVSAYMY